MGLSGDDSRFLIGIRMGDYLELMRNWDDNGNSMKTMWKLCGNDMGFKDETRSGKSSWIRVQA